MSDKLDYDTNESTIGGNPPDLNKVPVNKLEPYLHGKENQDIEDRDMPDTLKAVPRPEQETMHDLQDLKHSYDRKTTADVTRTMRTEKEGTYIQ
jgi:hypothetical protein